METAEATTFSPSISLVFTLWRGMILISMDDQIARVLIIFCQEEGPPKG